MGTARVAVFGSANMDLVVYADRAPGAGETVTGRQFVTGPGGKGANQAIAAARAGGDVVMVGAVGRDGHGDALRESLSAAGVRVDALARVEEPTGTAHIVVEADGNNRIVVVPGANGTFDAAPAVLDDVLEDCDILLLQLELPVAAVTAAARRARAKGVRVLLTPAPLIPLPPDLVRASDLLVPNEPEAAGIAGVSTGDPAVEQLTELVPEVVITQGSRGALWLTQTNEPFLVPAYQVPATDTTAAGDTFVGALAVAMTEGRAMPDAMGWAAAASALSVQRSGASGSMPTRAEIDTFVTEARTV